MGQEAESPAPVPRHILVPLDSADLGGSQLALLRLIDALPTGFARFSFWLFGRGALCAELDRREIPWRWLPRAALRTPWGLAGLLRRMRREQPDLLYLHAGRVFSLLARRAGIPCLERINVPRASGAGGWSRWSWIDRWCTCMATRALVVSHALRRQLMARGVPPEQLIVLRDPIDPAVLRRPELRAALRRRLELAPQTPLILNVGRLVPAKAQRGFLRLAAAVRQRLPQARFLIIGSGPLESDLRREISRLALADCVTLLPFEREIAGYCAAADFYVQTSHWEGLPGVVLEARAAGLPVVATDVGGTAEALTGYEASRLVAVGDTAALAEAVVEMISGGEQPERATPVAPFPAEFTPAEVGRHFMAVVASALAPDRGIDPGWPAPETPDLGAVR